MCNWVRIVHDQSAEDDLNTISYMFNMNINFENEWLNFIGRKALD